MTRRDVLLFAHIERSAGTSIHRFLLDHLIGYRVTSSRNRLFSNEPEGALSGEELDMLLSFPRVSGLGGHALRPWTEIGSRFRPHWITVLRHPIDRFLSHLSHHVEVARCDWNLARFAADKRLWNWQVVRLAGYTSVDEAMVQLEGMAAAAIGAPVDAFIRDAVRHLGVEPTRALARVNATTAHRLTWKELGQAERGAVERANTYDLELWERAQRRFGTSIFRDQSAGALADRARRFRPFVPWLQPAWSIAWEAPVRRRFDAFPGVELFSRVERRSAELFPDADGEVE